MESASSGSSKRTRMPNNGTNQVPSCLVDGCTSDLSKCRDYHRRHKVCEIHSKTPKVFIKGIEQRFCQQCSRFHSLLEFDERKRSCRKRLEGHNRRRRKPQPDPLSMNSSSLFSNHQGTRYLQFGGSHIFSTAATSSTWASAVKPETDAMLYNSQSLLNFSNRKGMFAGSMSHDHMEGKQFPFLQGTVGSLPPGDPVIGQHDGLTRVIDSSRALSLLSSPLNEDHREIGVSHNNLMQNTSLSESLMPRSTYNNSTRNETEQFGSINIVSDNVSNVNVSNARGGAMFHQIGLDFSSTSGSHQTLSFSWEE